MWGAVSMMSCGLRWVKRPQPQYRAIRAMLGGRTLGVGQGGGSRVAALSVNAPVSPGLLAGLVQMLPCGGCMGPCAAPVASRAWDAEPGMSVLTFVSLQAAWAPQQLQQLILRCPDWTASVLMQQR